MIKIYSVKAPLFRYNGQNYGVVSYPCKSFTEFDKLVTEKEKDGFTHCFLYEVYNVDLMETPMNRIIFRATFERVNSIKDENYVRDTIIVEEDKDEEEIIL